MPTKWKYHYQNGKYITITACRWLSAWGSAHRFSPARWIEAPRSRAPGTAKAACHALAVPVQSLIAEKKR